MPRPASACARHAATATLSSPTRSFGGLDDDELVVDRVGEVQALARERFDPRMRRPRALLDLEAAPIDLQLILLAVERLELDEELPGTMLRARDPDAGRSDGG